MRARGAAFAVPAVVGSLWVQARRAAHAPLPEFGDLDPTGYYGGEDDTSGDPVRVAALGDSTVTGPGLDHARHVFVGQAAGRSPRRVHLARFAVGGSRVADVLTDQLPAAIDARPEVAVLSVGANDAIHGTPLTQFERDLRTVVGTLDHAGVRTIVCGLIDLSVVPRIPVLLKPLLAHRGAAYERRKVRAIHPAARAVYVPADRKVNEAFRARGEEFFAADRFHPNRWGHGCLATALAPYLVAAVEAAYRARVTVPSC
jgi:lysophospholipase L1-like esterase